MRLALGGALLFLCSRGSADGAHERIRLRLDPSVEVCVADGLEAVRQAVTLELGATLVDDEQPDVVRVDVTCRGDAAAISVGNPATGTITERRLDLSAEPFVSRPRLLGLAIAEMVASRGSPVESPAPISWPLATLPPPPGSTPELTVATPAPVPPASRLSLGASAIGRMFASGGLATLGGRVFADWIVTPRLVLGADLAGERGDGSAGAEVVDLSLFSTTPRLAGRVFAGPIELNPGVGWRLGVADVNGVSHTAGVVSHHFDAAWGGPVATLEARGALASPIGFDVGVEVGVATLSVAAQLDGADVARIEGAWGALWVSITYTP